MGPAVLNDEVFVISLCTICDVIGGTCFGTAIIFTRILSFGRHHCLVGKT